MLSKRVKKVYVPGAPGVPGFPGTPAIPAWDEVITVAQQQAAAGSPSSMMQQLLNSVFQPVYDPLTNTIQYVQVTPGTTLQGIPQDPPPTSAGLSMGNAVKPHDIVVHHPAVPAVPPRPAVKASPGYWAAANGIAWDGGAYSKLRLDGNVQTTFQVPQVVGAVVGFTHDPTNQQYKKLPHSIYFATTNAQVYELGVPKGPVLVFSAADNWTIERLNNVITYKRNGSVFYTSTTKSAGSLIVEAVLYADSDRVI